MKKIYLIRHAKSSWKDPDKPDFARPLNKRGKKNAPEIGQYLKKQKLIPDLFLSSPAKRAISTAKLIAKELDFPEERIVQNERIYEANIAELISIISEIDDQLNNVFLIGHNPGITDLANKLSNTFVVNLPTSAVFGIEFNVDHWKEIKNSKGNCILFEYPKKMKNG